jgi:hypothetical protein
LSFLLATTLIISMVSASAAPLASGKVATYRPGIMKQVADNRGMAMLEWVDGYASTRHCHRVDTRADPTLKHRPWLVEARINGRPAEVYQVVDCSHPRDLNWHIRTGLILEVDYASGRRNGVTVQRNQVTILKIWRR